MRGASARATVDFPVPDRPPTASSRGAAGRRNPSARSRSSRAASRNGAAWAGSDCNPAAVALVFARTAARHDRKSGSSGNAVAVPGLVHPDVEQHVRVPAQLPAPHVHQQEGEIVEDVDAGNLVVELDGVEERRAPVDEADVAGGAGRRGSGGRRPSRRRCVEPVGLRLERRAAEGDRAVHRRPDRGSAAPCSANSAALPSITHAMPAPPPWCGPARRHGGSARSPAPAAASDAIDSAPRAAIDRTGSSSSKRAHLDEPVDRPRRSPPSAVARRTPG